MFNSGSINNLNRIEHSKVFIQLFKITIKIISNRDWIYIMTTKFHSVGNTQL